MSNENALHSDEPLTESILELANRAEDSLVRANTLIKSKVKIIEKPETISYWALFLENPPTSTVETCAISLGASTLLMSGEGVESSIIQNSAKLVAQLQRSDGGWTSFSPTEEEESLTIEAFFAIPFLVKANAEKYFDEIKKGVDWLIGIENPSGGWGFYQEDSSHVLTTSYAIRALAEWGRLQGDVILRDVLNRGLNWLIERQNEDGSWSQIKNKPGSTIQTAVALLALTTTGLFRPYSKPVVQGRNWLLDHLENRDEIVDNYIVPKRDVSGEIIGFHRRISHVSFPDGTIIQALLACGTDLTDKRLIRLVRNLIDSQERDGSWKSEAVAYEKPIFAVLDASIALRRFILQVKESERTLDIKENILSIDKRIEMIQIEQEAIRRSIEETIIKQEKIMEKLANVEAYINTKDDTLQKLRDFYDGLFWLQPLAFVGSWMRRYPLIAVLIIVFIVYIILRVFFSINYDWIDIATAAVGVILLTIELVHYYRSRKK
jgi:hypothetical protein